MISSTVVLCVCLPLFSCGVKFNNESGHLKQSGRFFGLEHVQDMMEKGLESISSSVSGSLQAISEKIVGEGYKTETMTRDSVAEIFGAAGETLHKGWEAALRVDYPGKEILMYFPNKVVAISDEAAKSVWFIKSAIKRYLPAANVHSIYAVLKAINDGMKPVLEKLGVDCVEMERLENNVNSWVIKRIELAAYTICGLSSLEPVNNVTVSNKGRQEVASVPYVIWNMDIKVPSVNVTNMLVTLLDNAPVHARINKTNIVGRFYFDKNKYLQLRKVTLRITNFEGVDVKIGVEDKKRTMIINIVEALSDVLADQIKQAVNKKMKEIEKPLTEALAALSF